MDLRISWELPILGCEARSKLKPAPVTFLGDHNSESFVYRHSLEDWVHFASLAEAAGIESIVIPCEPDGPDPLLVACALGRATDRLRMLPTYRSGWMEPVTFVHQFNTISELIGGRIALNFIAGDSTNQTCGDSLDFQSKHRQEKEFLSICSEFWSGDQHEVNFEGEYYQIEGGKLHTKFRSSHRKKPEILISGSTKQSRDMAHTYGATWVVAAVTPESVVGLIAASQEYGTELCLHVGLICRESKEDAIRSAEVLFEQKEALTNVVLERPESRCNETGAVWLNPNLMLRQEGGNSTAYLIGTADELVKAISEYREIGVTQFHLFGGPGSQDMKRFCHEVAPRLNHLS